MSFVMYPMCARVCTSILLTEFDCHSPDCTYHAAHPFFQNEPENDYSRCQHKIGCCHSTRITIYQSFNGSTEAILKPTCTARPRQKKKHNSKASSISRSIRGDRLAISTKRSWCVNVRPRFTPQSSRIVTYSPLYECHCIFYRCKRILLQMPPFVVKV